MPNCFTLTRKGDTSPAMLQEVDRHICQALELPYDDERWCCEWYNIIGLGVACGKSLAEMVDICQEGPLHRIAAFLSDNYTSDAWYEPR